MHAWSCRLISFDGAVNGAESKCERENSYTWLKVITMLLVQLLSVVSYVSALFVSVSFNRSDVFGLQN